MREHTTQQSRDDDLLLLPEVAEITRRSIDTLRWLRHKGEGPAGHRAGRRVYYRRGDVMAWLAEQGRADSTPPPSPPPDLPLTAVFLPFPEESRASSAP